MDDGSGDAETRTIVASEVRVWVGDGRRMNDDERERIDRNL